AMIKTQGYEATFFKFGIAQGAVVFLLGWFLRAPGDGFKAPAKPGVAGGVAVAAAAAREYAPVEMLKTPVFWVMYVMFVMMATGGLVATAQLTPIAKDFGIADSPVRLIGLT